MITSPCRGSGVPDSESTVCMRIWAFSSAVTERSASVVARLADVPPRLRGCAVEKRAVESKPEAVKPVPPVVPKPELIGRKNWTSRA